MEATKHFATLDTSEQKKPIMATCYKCGEQYKATPEEIARISDPDYEYDPEDFECEVCYTSDVSVFTPFNESEEED